MNVLNERVTPIDVRRQLVLDTDADYTQGNDALLSTADAKSHMHVDTSADDSLIDAYILTATRAAEQYTRRAFVNQTWDLWLDRAPDFRSIELAKGNLSSVTSVVSYGTDNTESTFSTDRYTVDTNSVPGRVFLDEGETWPTDLREFNAIRIRFIAGFGASASDVPDEIVHAIKFITADFYENRESGVIGSAAAEVKIPFTAMSLLNPYRLRLT